MTSSRNWFFLIISLTLGLGAGVFSAQFAIRQGSATPVETIGPWQSFREININEINPYALAHTSNYGNLKLANFEVLYFIARRDGKNRTLSGACEYVVRGNIPKARWWSLTVYDRQGFLINNPAERYSFNNSNISSKKEAGYSLNLAANARPGNWIPVNADAPFMIMLRLYSPGINSIRDANEIVFPTIERLGCS